MSTTASPSGRKAPHCKKCHKPSKGHRRGVCDAIEQDVDPSTLTTDTSSKSRTRRKSVSPHTTITPVALSIIGQDVDPSTFTTDTSSKSRTRRKSASPYTTITPLALSDIRQQSKSSPCPQSTPNDNDTLPSLSPRSSEILHNLLRENPVSDPTTLGSTSNRRNNSRSVHFEQLEQNKSEELLPDAFEQLSTEDEDARETKDNIARVITPQPEAEQKPLIKYGTSDSLFTKESLAAFLTSMFQNPQNPPAAMLSFPFADLLILRSAVASQGLYMCMVTVPEVEDGKLDTVWVPVVVGKTMPAVTRLLEESASSPKASNSEKTNLGSGMGMTLSHVAVGMLGALATWTGLAYS